MCVYNNIYNSLFSPCPEMDLKSDQLQKEKKGYNQRVDTGHDFGSARIKQIRQGHPAVESVPNNCTQRVP